MSATTAVMYNKNLLGETFQFFTPQEMGRSEQVNTVWRQALRSGEMRTWIYRNVWMPPISFEGRPFIVVNGEKIAATKMQYKLYLAKFGYRSVP